MRTELILAVDLDDKEDAKKLLRPLRGKISWVKIGLQLFTKHGPSVVREIENLGFKIFLDLKLHDIPNTVASAIKSLGGLPIEMLTIHTLGGKAMMEVAVEATRGALPSAQLLGVTVLTSMDSVALSRIGIGRSPLEQVKLLANLAVGAGMKGLVCSPLELPKLRGPLGKEIVLVTPGIRPRSASLDDQSRAMTPAEAARGGANFIVVGRPILRAQDPVRAVCKIKEELNFQESVEKVEKRLQNASSKKKTIKEMKALQERNLQKSP